MNNVLLWLLVGIFVLWIILSFAYIRRQQNVEIDKGMNPTIAKHPIGKNPAVWAYILYPIAVIAGVIIVWLFLRSL